MIAITGGIAEGKSTVLAMLDRLGYRTASADDLARILFEGDQVQSSIQKAFGTTSRDAIRELIAAKPHLRRELNRMMHRPIWERILELTPDFVEVPLLIETCLHIQFKKTWVVTCGEQEQRRRLVERLGATHQIDAILATQLPTRAKVQFADRIVRTNVELEHVLAFVTSAAVEDRTR